MSHQAVTAVLANSKTRGSDRLVLLVIASHADEIKFECFPGRDLLSQEAAMGERNLIYCLKKLEESGELVISRGNGRGNLTTYRINLPKVEEVKKVQAAAPFIPQERVQNPVETMQLPAPFEPERVQESASFNDQERVQDLVERVQSTVKRVQDSVIKGAKSGCAYKDIEPSGTVREPSGEPSTLGADAPEVEQPEPESKPESRKPPRKTSSGKKPDQPKSQFHFHPSVVAYRQVYRTVNAEQARLIAEATGVDAGEAPAQWLAFVSELALTGNKHAHNVRVMVLAYEKYKTGAALRDALNQAWCREKGEILPAVNGALSSFTPNAQKTVIALQSFVERNMAKEDV